MWATPFQIYLANLRKEIPEHWPYYVPQEEAYEKLKRISGQDFGYNDKLWEQWGRANGYFLTPSININEMVREE